MHDEEWPAEIRPRGHERAARGDAPSLGGGQMMQLDGQAHPPRPQRVREVLPHRKGRILLGYGRGHDTLGDKDAELLPVRVLFRPEPRHHTLEPLKPRHQALGRRAVHEERLEAEGVEGRGGEHEARALE
jgi:hypothetical protein